ncbi:AMP-binding protein [Ralstonia insidiosa]|jgi:acetyl-CoA synthetase|uniref:AMP-binding protein n=1 Tax=Ralstonia TaxID=48736 RepID=UPI000CEDE0B2|nr:MULTISPECIES: AMP-binding protein [Ralstonia]KAB0471114.1 AMP-binding protein [Ralstonia insidiosa]MBY4909373.1 AMP-binding protein [Ralstonia insidiosa]MDH6643385.1 acetyl-CoA synthetase [Ralstonia sp. GP73]
MRVDPTTAAAIVWQPDAAMVEQANLTRFMRALGVGSFEALNERASQNPAWFHDELIRYLDYRFERPYVRVLDISEGRPFAHWCVGGVTNVVINGLDRWRGTERYGQLALVWESEDGAVSTWTFADLDRETCRLAWGLRKLGIGHGDVVGMYLPNLPHAAAAMLAVAKVGAIVLPMFSGFGADAIAQRLTDGRAVTVITVDGSLRRGKPVGAKAVVDQALANCPGVRHVVVLRHLEAPHDWKQGRDHWWDELCAGAPEGVADVATASMPADAPFLLMFTSGTSGKPKGVVHSHCGFPIKTALDLSICMDLKPGDRFLWMSDMGWLVGPMLVFGGLLVGATVVLAEGAPNYPQPDRLWRLVERHRVSYLGLAPTIARLSMSLPAEALAERDLSSLRVMISTGEPWTPEPWHWTFERIGKGRVPLLNFSGGTEMGGILTGTVIHPLKPCAFAGAVPGTGADVVDASSGESVGVGVTGELVMRSPTIGLTRGLWHDRERYLDSYWSRLPDLWVHGDFASRDADGMWYVHGRSDDTLKIAGKRTGPAEIEALLMATGLLEDAVTIGVPDPIKGMAVVCLCVARPETDSESAVRTLSAAVTAGLGGAFKPADVVFVPDLPRTRNMKLMRRVVRSAWLGEEVGDLSTLVNPEAVQAIRDARLATKP